MGLAIITIGNAAAKVVAATPAATPLPASAVYWPAWFLAGGVVLALFIAVAILASLKSTLLAEPKKREEEFTRMLCKQVWKHTDAVTNFFAQRLRQPQRDVVTLRVLVRLLREDLAGPLNFVEQMRPQTPSAWPGYELFAAFNNWGGKIRAIESQLGDLQHMLSYPAVREPVDAHRDAMLVHYYATEQVALGQTISQLGNDAIAICEEARTLLKKESGHSFGFGLGGHDDDHHESGCTACGSAHAHTVYAGANARDLLPLPDPPKKEKEKKEEPKPKVCCCAMPRPCHCAQAACMCMCNCTPAVAAEAARH